jgi:RNA polymerase subunit RPABC4/transcription elongation factor Spt4
MNTCQSCGIPDASVADVAILFGGRASWCSTCVAMAKEDTTLCPRCGAVVPADDVGCIRHAACGYCKHPARDDGVCGICGHKEEDHGPV